MSSHKRDHPGSCLPRASFIASVLLLATVALLAGHGSLSAQWTVKEFEVVGITVGDWAFFRNNPRELADLALDRWATSRDTAEARLRREMETYLHEAALRLESWGFPEPVLEPIVHTADGRRAYRVFMFDLDVGGNYRPTHCFGDGIYRRRIAIDRSEMTQVVDGRTTVGARGFEILGHELFHAVQFAMPFFDPQCEGTAGDWVVEGTAKALGIDLARQLRRPIPPDSWGGRPYDRTLPVPLRRTRLPEADRADEVDAYETQSFWRYLAEMHHPSNAGRPGTGLHVRVDYSYMLRLFEVRPARDCNTRNAPCTAELKWLDDRLIRLFGMNLKEIFPLFIETVGTYGESGGRASRNWLTMRLLDPTDWRGRVFGAGCPSVRLGRGLGRRVLKTATFPPVAANCWNVTIANPAEGAELGVTAIGPRGAPSLAHLSVAIGGPPVEADSGEVVFTQDRTQADWVYPAADSMLVFMTNVAPDPADTDVLFDLPVVFTLLEPYATIVSVTSTPGPSGDEVDRPVGVDFDNGLRGVVTDMADLYLSDPGLAEPCVIRVQGLSNSQGDALVFGMDHEGPIRPGEYPVASSQVEYGGRDPWPPGMAVVHFRFGAGNPMSLGVYQGFIGDAGTLSIESVSGGSVRGVLDVSGVNRLAERIALGDDPPDVYVPNATIRVEFSLPMRDPGDPARNAGVVTCLDAERG